MKIDQNNIYFKHHGRPFAMHLLNGIHFFIFIYSYMHNIGITVYERPFILRSRYIHK